ncbi:thioviridamide family RiPP peptide [Amycolatopsis sp. NPDC059090]|uniref:thioviridamide family RiPP peptide n=1 Tax=unclassified Amycolatopsis TaxID=2618356 RepID=UPI00366BD3E2
MDSHDVNVSASISDEDIENLVQQIKSEESNEAVDGLSLAEISGFSEEELQRFLEEKAGLTAASGVQQSIAGFAVTVAVHC